MASEAIRPMNGETRSAKSAIRPMAARQLGSMAATRAPSLRRAQIPSALGAR